uniref:Tyrosine-protein phosphatase domain-containing protein n=1 Tax=Strongyloides papillosus TaxID=174720 RepID=A0A0N5BI75_STREA
MSILLYFLAASLALVPLSIYCEEVTNYFPSVPGIINETTFPVRLTVNTTSDVVLIKCPYFGYKHTNDSKEFSPNTFLRRSALTYNTDNELFAWIPLMKKSPGLINVDCGGVIFMNDTGNQSCHWKYDVYWGNYGNSSNLPEATFIPLMVPLMHTKCNSSPADEPLVFTKNKNNELVKVNSSNDNVVYIKKMFYYFEKPKEDDVKEVLEPCAITIAYSECPSIILPDFKSNFTIRTGLFNYKKYLSNFLSHQSSMNSDLEQFLSFVNVLDSGKLDEYEAIFTNIGTMTSMDLFNSCRHFYIAVRNKYVKKTRYSDIVCLDSTAVTIRGQPTTDMESFIHANKFVYNTSDQKERKLILCQGPLDDTRDDMLGMIFMYKISLVVILFKSEEAGSRYNKWTQYFPESNTTLVFGSSFVTKTNYKCTDTSCIS